MGPDLQDSAVPLRCPTCAAAVRPGAPWCTQCYADLRPAPAPEPAPEPAPAPPAAPAVPLRQASTVVTAEGEAAWPCTSCGAAVPLAAPACPVCGAGFLAALRAAEEPLLVLPVVGDLAALGRPQRLALATGVVLAVVLLTALLGFLLG